jgi:hypothetical protein
MTTDIYDSSVRSAGDLAGVFECDDETGYFYLFDETRTEGDKILGAIQITNSRPDFRQEDIDVRWDSKEIKVGLFIRDELWAAFDETGKRYGGMYHPGGHSDIPEDIRRAFEKRTSS